MTLYAFTKTMIRELTSEEKKEIKAYILEHQRMRTNELACVFEKKFDTPITETCILALMIENAMEKGV